MKTPKPIKRGERWSCQIMVGGQRHYVSAEDEATCLARAMELKAGLVSAASDSQRTLSQAIDSYISRKENVLSVSTVRGYRILQKNRFQSIMDVPVRKLDRKKLQAAVNAEARLCAPKTLKNAVGLVLSVLADETGTRISVQTPQVVPHEHPFLSPDELPAFLDAIRGTDIEIPCLLGLWSLRRSELLALRWKDLDVKKKLIHVLGALVPDTENRFVRKDTTKNATSRRTVPMCDRLQELLRPMAAGADPEALVLDINPETLRKRINALCEKHGLPAVGIHGLRHSFISVGYMANVPMQVLMEIGGWANDATIKARYLHIAQADRSRWQDSMMAAFNGSR